MRGQRSVERASRPTIVVRTHVLNHSSVRSAIETGLELRTDLAEHRLDGQDHSFAQLETSSPFAVVVTLRFLMHPPADSVADEVADDVEAAGLRVLLNRRTDVAEVT